MALRLNLENTAVGVAFNAAYAKVESVQVDYMPSEDVELNALVLKAHALVRFYASEDARLNNAQPVHQQLFRMEVPSGDLMPGVYNYLKMLPEFENSEDC